jgi:hypothetical protein
MTVLADPVAEAHRLVDLARATGLTLRIVGGIGVAIHAPSIGRADPPRIYHDIDLVAPAGSAAVARCMSAAGYLPAQRFNALNGSERLLFHDPSGRRIDVFIERITMCHVLDLRDRLTIHPWTLPPADLLLSKLQIVEMTERDAQDVQALLTDRNLSNDDDGIDRRRLRAVCAADWGWWRTVDGSLARLIERWRAETAANETLAIPIARAVAIRTDLAAAPTSLAWRVRARIGERMRWYELPEEVR